MKGLNFLDKLAFLCNLIVAVLLLFSYVLPYIAPENFSFLSVLSLGVPFLIVVNVLFFVYWLLKVKKQMLLSLVVLLLGINYVTSLYKFSKSKDIEDSGNFTVMSYNVRLFNQWKWIKGNDVDNAILSLIKNKKPDILSIQEHLSKPKIGQPNYPYKYIKSPHLGQKNIGQAIYAKYPIIDSGSINFPKTLNNAIYADIKKGNDTIRVYNVHLESLGISKEVEELNTTESERLFKNAENTFKMQQLQAEMVVKHMQSCTYPKIITGDFNNTPYSYVYKIIKEDLFDTFTEAGNGFGRTFDFKYFPIRIDYILVDPNFAINGFKSFDEKLSDHFPIMTTLKLHK